MMGARGTWWGALCLRSWALALVVLLSGCEQLGDFLPKVSFDGLEIREIDWEKANVDFVFSVNNPNPVSVGLTSFSYNLDLEAVPFLSGDNPEGFQLEAMGASPLVLPLDLTYANVFETIQATRGEDEVGFGLYGKMGFDTPAGNVQLPYNQDGGFPALRPPAFSFQALRVPKVDILAGTADLELDLGIDNDLGTTMFFDRFDFTLNLEGTRVANGLIDTFDAVGASTSTVTLPVTIDALDLVFVLADAIATGEHLDLGLAASMDVETPFGIVPLTIDEAGDLGIDL